jgi:hypothetical protein
VGLGPAHYHCLDLPMTSYDSEASLVTSCDPMMEVVGVMWSLAGLGWSIYSPLSSSYAIWRY